MILPTVTMRNTAEGVAVLVVVARQVYPTAVRRYLEQVVAQVAMVEAKVEYGEHTIGTNQTVQLVVMTAHRILTAVEAVAQVEVMPPMAPLVVRVECQVAAVAEAGHKVEAVQAGKAHAEKSGCGFTNERHNTKKSSRR